MSTVLKPISRRRFLEMLGMAAGATALAACAQPTPTPTPKPAATAAAQPTVAPTAVPPTAVPKPTQPPAREIIFLAGWGGTGGEGLRKICADASAKKNIKASYEQSNNVEALIRTRLAGGNPPDVALQTRPGVMTELAQAGSLTPLNDPVGKEVFKPGELEKIYPAPLLEFTKIGGIQYGFPFKADNKSLFFYNPATFKKLGVQVPKTWAELKTAADKLVAGGLAPFSLGAGDGWILTDWFENALIRVASAKTYNDLHVTHKVAWTDPGVKKALQTIADLFGTKGYLDGGPSGALGFGFGESVSRVFSTKPTAAMIMEGGFAGTTATEDVNKDLKEGETIDNFAFPQIDPQFGDPVVGGADFAVIFRDSPEARLFMQYLTTGEAGATLAKIGCVIPNKLVEPSAFTSIMTRSQQAQVLNAKTFVFDGSDLAPSALGGDYEFTKLQDLVAHPTEVERIAGEFEAFAKNLYK